MKKRIRGKIRKDGGERIRRNNERKVDKDGKLGKSNMKEW